jgi:hypothetical protein
LSLEEINEKFGDIVRVHITHISEEEQRKLDITVQGIGEAIPDVLLFEVKNQPVHEEHVDCPKN